MKKISLYLSSLAVILLFFHLAFAQTAPQQVINPPPGPDYECEIILLKPGDRNENVKILQQILRNDPRLYPEGIVTGYYGPLTQEAVKRLQQKLGLPVTGEVDEQTSKIIFPCLPKLKLTVTSPNGGEVWEKGKTYQINWKIFYPEIPPFSQTELPFPILKFYFPGAIFVLDLIKSDGSLVTNIGQTPLPSQTYRWTIPFSIPDGNDYKVRVTLKGTYCPPNKICPQVISEILSDESDGVFTITREKVPPPPLPRELKLTVTSPNGGEVWEKGKTYQINWRIESLTFPIVEAYFRGAIFVLDLIKSDGSLVTNIGQTPLPSQTYRWTIPFSIPDGNDYKVRVTLKGTYCPPNKICPQVISEILSDESDGVFTITTPSQENIKKAIEILKDINKQIQELIRLLETIKF